MTDYTATGASASTPAFGYGGAGDTVVVNSIYTPSTTLLANDRILMARLPKGAVIVGGRVYGANLDSTGSGSALLDMDLGVDMGGTVDTDQLGNFGIWSSAAVAGVKPEVGYEMPLGGLLRTAGPQTMTGDYNHVYLTVVASAAGQTAGKVGLELRYRIGAHS
ncbi:MAG: hypothetical protein AB7O43_15150 [Hyphomicrobiaceae bacterium]